MLSGVGERARLIVTVSKRCDVVMRLLVGDGPVLTPRPMFNADISAAEFLVCLGVLVGISVRLIVLGGIVVGLVSKYFGSSCLGGLWGGVGRGEGG